MSKGGAAPSRSALTLPFWEAAQRHKLVRQRCRTCGTQIFTPQIACRACLSEDLAWEESSGEGVIHSATIVHRPPDPDIPVPYVLANIMMDEGWPILTNIVDCPPESALIGRRVRVAWDRVVDGWTVPTFVLDERENVR